MKRLCAYRITRGNLTRLKESIQGELEAIVFYQQLLTLTSDRETKTILTHLLNDEKKHLCLLEGLYKEITGSCPLFPQPITPYIMSFCDGVLDAFFDELEAYETYRNLYLANPGSRCRAVFFEAMTDENEHAIQLNYLISKLSCRRHSHYSETEKALHTPTPMKKEQKKEPCAPLAEKPKLDPPVMAETAAGKPPLPPDKPAEPVASSVEVEVEVESAGTGSTQVEVEVEVEQTAPTPAHPPQKMSPPPSSDKHSLGRIDHLWEFVKGD